MHGELFSTYRDKQGRTRHRFDTPSEEPLPHEGVAVDFDALLAERKKIREDVRLGWTPNVGEQLRMKARERQIEPEMLYREVAQHILSRVERKIGSGLETQEFFPLQSLLDFRAYMEEQGIQELTKMHEQESGDIGGLFDHGTGEIFVRRDYMDTYGLIEKFAAGSFFPTVKMFVHEKIHSIQKRPDATQVQERYKIIMREYGELIMLLSGLMSLAADKPLAIIPAWAVLFASMRFASQESRDRRILHEVHAYKSEEVTSPGERLSNAFNTHPAPNSRPALQKRIRPLISVLRGPTYELKTKKDIDRIIAASQVIDRLYALGFTVSEVGKMTEHVGYSPGSRGYTHLEKIIREKCKEKNLRVEQLDLLTDKRTIEREIRLLTIALIAQEEVKKAVESKP